MSLLQDHVSLGGGGGSAGGDGRVATRWAANLFTFVQVLGMNKQAAVSERAVVGITTKEKNWCHKKAMTFARTDKTHTHTNAARGLGLFDAYRHGKVGWVNLQDLLVHFGQKRHLGGFDLPLAES